MAPGVTLDVNSFHYPMYSVEYIKNTKIRTPILWWKKNFYDICAYTFSSAELVERRTRLNSKASLILQSNFDVRIFETGKGRWHCSTDSVGIFSQLVLYKRFCGD
jgi:hypothetical protein